ncbi:hypothetical protein ACWEQ7_22875 [Streptomyces sp. NPDC004069]
MRGAGPGEFDLGGGREWIADTPAHVLRQLGVPPDPVLPGRQLPSESAVRRLLARVDGDALDRVVGQWLSDRRPVTAEPRMDAPDMKIWSPVSR